MAAELDDVLVGAVKHAVSVLHLAEVDQLEGPLDDLQGHVARSAAADDRFARLDTAELTIELATTRWVSAPNERLLRSGRGLFADRST